MTRTEMTPDTVPDTPTFSAGAHAKAKAKMAAEMEMEAVEMTAEGPEPERADNGLIPALHEHDISPIPGG